MGKTKVTFRCYVFKLAWSILAKNNAHILWKDLGSQRQGTSWSRSKNTRTRTTQGGNANYITKPIRQITVLTRVSSQHQSNTNNRAMYFWGLFKVLKQPGASEGPSPKPPDSQNRKRPKPAVFSHTWTVSELCSARAWAPAHLEHQARLHSGIASLWKPLV